MKQGMDHLKNPDSIRRIKLFCSLFAAYIFSFFLVKFFFVGAGPELNPLAFQQIGKEVQNLSGSMQVFMQSEKRSDSHTASSSSLSTEPGDNILPSEIPKTSPLTPQPSNPTLIPTVLQQDPSSAPTIQPPTGAPTQKPQPTNPPQPTQPKTVVTYADFGKCLDNNGMVMYMTETCGLCSQQKKTLKDAFNFIRAVDCNANQANGLECSQVGVRGLPTWAKDGKAVYSGPQSLATLGSTAGCQVPTQQ